MFSFVDTHCHIDTILGKTGEDIDSLFSRMEPAPAAIIHVACDPDDYEYAEKLLSKKVINNVNIYGAFGVHPLEAEKYSLQSEARLLECLKLPGTLALGEIGLDYHYESYNSELQKKVFLKQLEIALELNKKIVFHLREAEDDALEILKKIDNNNIKAHIHCYTGTADFAKKVLELKGSYFFGFTGAITFNKTETIREAAACIPLNRILLETDAPYLAPVPFRGKICTPNMIPKIAESLSAIKNIPLNKIFKACRENTKEMYEISAG